MQGMDPRRQFNNIDITYVSGNVRIKGDEEPTGLLKWEPHFHSSPKPFFCLSKAYLMMEIRQW